MLVSIITPSYNQDGYIENTIQSVLAQDYPQIEYRIIDGGSTDSTVEVIKKYENRLAGWVSEKDHGQTDAINKGFGQAQGDILAWINSDDTYEPGAVRAAVTYLQEHPDVGMVYADCNYINEAGDVIGMSAIRRWGDIVHPCAEQRADQRADRPEPPGFQQSNEIVDGRRRK